MELLKIISPVAVLALLWGCYAFWHSKRRKRLVISLKNSKLIAEGISNSDKISVKYDLSEILDPHIVTIDMVNGGHKDIESKDFDGDKPLVINLNCKIVAVLQSESATIEHTFDGKHLKIAPTLLARGKAYSVQVLTEGEPKLSIDQDRLIDTDVWNGEERVAVDKKRKGWARAGALICMTLALAPLGASAIGVTIALEKKSAAVAEAATAVREIANGGPNFGSASDLEGAAKNLEDLNSKDFMPQWGTFVLFCSLALVLVAYVFLFYMIRLSGRIADATGIGKR
ncbi:hypothetical protein ACFV24_31160 [Nocardia fluminea]|uniref:hypothetical protein n=1 Tax=Nocardia fluminea TaxID=134984 RepID=UPI00366F8B65